MSHLSEEQLVDVFYEDSPSAGFREHLDGCSECRARLAQLSEMLRSVRGYPVPERNESYVKELWASLAPQLPAKAEKKKWHWAWALAPALAALLTITFLAGVWTERHHTSALPDRSRERALLISMSDHLERSQIVLAELIHANPGAPDLGDQQKRAQSLLAENRLLRQTALNQGDRTHAALLDDLERILLVLANGPGETKGDDLKQLQKRVEDDGLLWKIRVTSMNAREKGQKL
jgi:hypothetical protein